MSPRSKFGITLFNIPVNQQIDLAVLAEELGFDAVWIGEHVVMPIGYQSYVPSYTTDPQQAGIKHRPIDESTLLYDLLCIASAMGRATNRVEIITGIYLLALRHPLLTARAVATVAEIAEGRFSLGVAAGWNKEEFDIFGVPFDKRGRILDESIEVLRRALRSGAFEHHGEHFSFDPVQVTPAPVDVPIIIGGNGAPARRRAAQLGDGWFASGENDVEEVLRLRDQIDDLRRRSGSNGQPFRHWIKVNASEPEQIRQLEARGADRFVLYGDRLWSLEPVPYSTRCERLKSVADALGLGGRPVGPRG